MKRSTLSRNALWARYKKRLLPGTDVVHVGLALETFLSLRQRTYFWGMIEVESGTLVALAEPFPNLEPGLPGEVRMGFLFSFCFVWNSEKNAFFSVSWTGAQGLVL